MGNCFSSSPEGSHPTSPLSVATSAATNALNAVNAALNPASTVTPDAKVKQVLHGAYITKVPDGDTFTCTLNGETKRVRVMGIDSPETRQNYGREAGDLARSLLLHQTVTLHIHTTDRYNRIVADVILSSGENFAHHMLSQGAAWHYKAYDKRQVYAELQNEAKEQKIGLWSFARPQPPWDYRRKKRQT